MHVLNISSVHTHTCTHYKYLLFDIHRLKHIIKNIVNKLTISTPFKILL